jgi:hypothetical protein
MLQRALSNIDVVVYALFKLGGYERKIHTEEIAYEAYCLAKERFAWKLRRFRNMGFPDKERVRRGLADAAKEKYGCLVEGRADVHIKGRETEGWVLTPEGVTWIRKNEKRIESVLGTTRPRTPFVDTLRFKKRMREQPLFRRFLENQNLEGQNLYNLTDMLNISSDSPKEVIAMNFRTLRSNAELVGDQQIIAFLNGCALAFSTVLTSPATEDQRIESSSTDDLLLF